ncbi:MAG: guanylate kinase [Cyanobacteria bacterium J06614_10]
MVSLSPPPEQPSIPSTLTAAGRSPTYGQLIVLSGPSGVGKGSLLKRLLRHHPELQLSISATTRQPRAGEIHGQHYYFVSREKFQTMAKNGELLEWAEFAGNCYGTPKEPIEQAIAQGRRVILEIELVGARQVRASFPDAMQIFVAPPDVQALEDRIRTRGQESESAIAKRLARASVELAAASEFDVRIVNDNFEQALADLEAAIFG